MRLPLALLFDTRRRSTWAPARVPVHLAGPRDRVYSGKAGGTIVSLLGEACVTDSQSEVFTTWPSLDRYNSR